MDEDVFYLGVTVAVILVIGAAHNVLLTEEDARDFGYCDTSLSCAGMEVSGLCLGVQQQQTQCYDPQDASEYRRIEAECGVLAQNYCTSGEYTGTGWASDAEYRNTTCRQWAQQREKVDLLSCDQTTPPVTKWDEIG